MKVILLGIFCFLPTVALADIVCENPTAVDQIDFTFFQYHEECQNQDVRSYSELGDKLVTGSYPSEHDYLIEIRLRPDHTADIINKDDIWYYTMGGNYTFWDKFKTTWTSKDNEIFIKDVGNGIAIKCTNLKDPVLNFSYTSSLKGQLVGKTRLISYGETKEYAANICKDGVQDTPIVDKN